MAPQHLTDRDENSAEAAQHRPNLPGSGRAGPTHISVEHRRNLARRPRFNFGRNQSQTGELVKVDQKRAELQISAPSNEMSAAKSKSELPDPRADLTCTRRVDHASAAGDAQGPRGPFFGLNLERGTLRSTAQKWTLGGEPVAQRGLLAWIRMGIAAEMERAIALPSFVGFGNQNALGVRKLADTKLVVVNSQCCPKFAQTWSIRSTWAQIW